MYKTTFELFNEETADQEQIGNSVIQEIFLFCFAGYRFDIVHSACFG